MERRLSDLVQDQQGRESRINERFNDQLTQSHSVNDRLMEKLMGLERIVEEQRVQILHLESNARVTKPELQTPDKPTPCQLFPESGNPSPSHPQNDTSGNSTGSHSHNGSPGNPLGSGPNDPPGSHSINDTDFNSLRETVRRLSFWILQIIGALDLGENPGMVTFPNTRTCRDLAQLKQEVETLQQKCDECHSKSTCRPGETLGRFLLWKLQLAC